MSEKVQYGYIRFYVLAILCAGLDQKVKLSQDSTQRE